MSRSDLVSVSLSPSTGMGFFHMKYVQQKTPIPRVDTHLEDLGALNTEYHLRTMTS